MGTLKPHNNEPLYYDTVIGTLAVDGWAVTTFGNTAIRDWADCGPAQSLIAVLPNVVTAHPSTASVPTSYYPMWHSVSQKNWTIFHVSITFTNTVRF